MVLGGLTKPLRGILQAGKQFLGLRELVGTDSLGTKYYRYKEKNDYGDYVERRECKPREPDAWNVNMVPPAWRQWLGGNRESPPTQEELAKSEERVALVRARAAAIQKEEERRRLRGQFGASSEESPSMEQVLRQLQQAGHAPPGDKYAVPPQAGKGSGETFEAEPWQPGKRA